MMISAQILCKPPPGDDETVIGWLQSTSSFIKSACRSESSLVAAGLSYKRTGCLLAVTHLK